MFWYILLGIFAYMIIQMGIRPYLALQFYKKQGMFTRFFPIIAGVPQLIKNLKEHSDAMYEQKALSKNLPDCDAVAGNFGKTPLITLVDTSLLKEFAFKDEYYEKYQPKIFTNLVGPKALFIAQGEEWKKQRKLISQHFHFDLLKSNIPTVISVAKEICREIKVQKKSKIDILEEVQLATGEVVGRIFFGEHLSSYTYNGEKLPRALANINKNSIRIVFDPFNLIFGEDFVNRGIMPFHKKIINDMKGFRAVCEKIVDDRIASNTQDSHDMLSSSINEMGNNINKEGIVDNFISFFTGGMDTTAHLIVVVLYQLVKYPELAKKVQEEIDTYYNQKECPNIDDLKSMEYFDAFIKETLRFYTPAPGTIMRVSKQDHTLGKYQIRKGDLVSAAAFPNWFNKKYFDNEEEFNPDRWLNGKTVSDPFAFAPFWAGPRNCIGQHLAVHETKIITSEFLKAFNFELEENFKLVMNLGSGYEATPPIKFNIKEK